MKGGTINTSGTSNALPAPNWKPCGVSNLIDGLVSDKWVLPENKWQEVAGIYRAHSEKYWSELVAVRNKRSCELYADGWVARWIDDTARCHWVAEPGESE